MTTPSNGVYDVYALQYGARRGRKSREYAGFRLYGDDDDDVDVGYFFWVIRNDERVILLDCGYNLERAAAAGRYQANDISVSPLEVLGSLGIRAEEVDMVVLSHLHLDHAGNVSSFVNAEIVLAHAELEWWSGPLAGKELMTHLGEREIIEDLAHARSEGRLRLVDSTQAIAPGIAVTAVGGHSPGQLIVTVQGRTVPVVLASDAAHFYEEYRADRPFWVFSDLDAVYRGYETLRQQEALGMNVVPGHDGIVMTRFAEVADGIVDLGRPLTQQRER